MNEFVMFVGPMFGGKTSKLLSAIDRYRHQGKDICVFKPMVDERYSKNEIVTHWGGRSLANRVSSGDELYSQVPNEPCVIAVDEAFMVPGVGNILKELFLKGNTILVSSLQLSSDGEPYEEIQIMMPYATKIEVCPAVCTQCDRDAHYTMKVGGRSDHRIEIGGLGMYQPRCFNHFIDEVIGS